MNSNMLMYISLILYALLMAIGFLFRTQWIFMIAGLLWFIPIVEIDNTFIRIIAISMILFHAILGFGIGKKEDDFE